MDKKVLKEKSSIVIRITLLLALIVTFLLGNNTIVFSESSDGVVTSSSSSTESTTTSSSSYDLVAASSSENYWWDTIHNQYFTRQYDYIGSTGNSVKINTTQGWLYLNEAEELEGWEFVDVEYQGQHYQPNEKIYSDNFKNLRGLVEGLKINMKPLMFNLKIAYEGIPEEISKNLPQYETQLSGSQYTVHEAPDLTSYGYQTDNRIWMYSTNYYGVYYSLGETVWIGGGTLANRIQYNYSPIEVAQPLTVKYLDVDGNPISAETVVQGELNAPYSQQALSLPGYSLVEIIGNETGVFSTTPLELTYVYKEDKNENFTNISIDNSNNFITSFEDSDLELTISLNYNLYRLYYTYDNFAVNRVGTTASANLIGKKVKVLKRIVTTNGSIYLLFNIDGVQYIVHSAALRGDSSATVTTTASLEQYSSVSLDVKGNYLTSLSEVTKNVQLINNYNVYNLGQTGGSSDLSPFVSTSQASNYIGRIFSIRAEATSANNNRYYIISDGDIEYLININAFLDVSA